MENIPDSVDSKFRLVLLAAERGEQLVRGAAARSERSHEKLARVALDEIAHDLVRWGYGPPRESEAEEDAIDASEIATSET